MPIVAFSVLLLKLLRTIETNLENPKQKAIIAALNQTHAWKFWQYDGKRFNFDWIDLDEFGSWAFISVVFANISDLFSAFSGAFEPTIDFEYGIRIFKSKDEYFRIGHGIEIYEPKVAPTGRQIDFQELNETVKILKNGKPCFLFVDESNLLAYWTLVRALKNNAVPVRCLTIRSVCVQPDWSAALQASQPLFNDSFKEFYYDCISGQAGLLNFLIAIVTKLAHLCNLQVTTVRTAMKKCGKLVVTNRF